MDRPEPNRPLKIFQVATGFPGWGGAEKHVMDLTQALAARGHDVTVLVRPESWVEKRAGELGLATIPIRVHKQNDWRDYRLLREILRRDRPDVVHVHCNSDIVVHGVAALQERTPARIATRHLPIPFQNWIGAKLYSGLLLTKIVTVSEFVRQRMIGSGVSPRRVTTIHHGTDVEAFNLITVAWDEMRREFGLGPDTIAVGIAGRIAQEKGHEALLRAFQPLAAKYDVTLLVLGEGPYREEAGALAEHLGIADRVVFAGFRNDVNNAVNAFDIAAVPSVWEEACSAAIQQGMALAKPVVGTTTGGSPEMIMDEVTGFVVAPSDAAALERALGRLIVDADLRRAMGEAGQARVKADFTLAGMTDKLERLYYSQARKPGRR